MAVSPGNIASNASTVTFLFTDIEGSTKRWDTMPDAMRSALAHHDVLLRSAIENNGGTVFKTVGDAFYAAFPTALNGLAAALTAQHSLRTEDWGKGGAVNVRMAVHTGTVERRDNDYFGPPLNRVARLLSEGKGGQILISLATYELVRDSLPQGVSLVDIGERYLKGLQRPERVFELQTSDQPSIPPCPYRGLFAFQEQDSPFFFGREAFTSKLVEIVHNKSLVAVIGPVTVIGPSGSGKSSVVFAGLVPRLRKEGNWIIESFRPGEQPLQSLAAVLIPLLEPLMSETDRLVETRKLAEAFRHNDLDLRDIISRILQKNTETQRFLLVIDGFEEIYTLCRSAEERQRFLDLLLEASRGKPLLTSAEDTGSSVKSPNGAASTLAPNLKIVVTMRADFMEQALSYRPLVDALQDADLKLGPMSRQELQSAIEEPARLLNVEIEEGLTERILDTLAEAPGDLPLLEFALSQLWEKQQNRTLTHAAYDEIGGVEEALAIYAEEVYNRFSPNEQERIKRTFTQLVRPGEGAADTRRKATRSEVPEENWDLVVRLADARLVVTSWDEATGEDSVDIVHEALIRSWFRLREWVDRDRSFRSWQERLRAAMREWLANNKDEGVLLRGASLTEAERWLQERRADIGEREQEFILAAIALREHDRKAEEIRKEYELELAREAAISERRAASRLRYMVVALGIFLLVAVGLSAWAVNRSQAADDNARQATTNETRAQQNAKEAQDNAAKYQAQFTHSDALRLAAEANSLFEAQGNYDLIALLSLRSMHTQYTPQGDAALAEAMSLQYPVRMFTGHTAGVWGVAFSPDGKYVATGGYDKTARIWDAASGTQVLSLTHPALVWDVTFSPDGKYLLTAGQDKTARLWDAHTGVVVRAFTGHSDEVRSVAYSPDGKYILTGSLDYTARLWDANTANQLQLFSGHSDIVSSVKFSPDGKYVLTGSLDGTAQIWDPATGKPLRRFDATADGGVVDVAFSPDGKYILGGNRNGQSVLWDASNAREIRRFVGPAAATDGVAFSPDGKYVATSSEDKTARLWDAASGTELRRFTGSPGPALRLAFSPDGQYILFGSQDYIARLWDPLIAHGLPQFIGHTNSLQGAVFSPDGKYVLTTSVDKTAKLWDAKTGKELRTFAGHTDSLGLGVFSPDGRYVLTGSFDKDKTARMWDVDTAKELKRFVGHADVVYGVAFSPDGKYVATASWDHTAALWDVQTASRIRQFTGHDRSVYSVAFSPDGKYLLTGSADASARLWDVNTGKEVRRFVIAGSNDPLLSVRFSPDGKYALTGGYDKAAHLWDVQSGAKVRDYTGPTDVLWGVAFSPDGKYIVAASSDKTARIWDAQTGAELRRLTGHTMGLETAVFSPDGKYVLTASDDNTARIWDVDYKSASSSLCGRLLRDFTSEERTQYAIPDNAPTCP